jgi:hypothetical protein
MSLVYQYSILLSGASALAEEVQTPLIVLSILVVIASLALAGYILLKNNNSRPPEAPTSLGNYLVTKEESGPTKKPDLGLSTESAPDGAPVAPTSRIPEPLRISSLRIEPVSARSGELVTIWFDATNLDSTQIVHQVIIKIDDIMFNTRLVSILPGTVLHLNFKVLVTNPGSHTADVNGATGVFAIRP